MAEPLRIEGFVGDDLATAATVAEFLEDAGGGPVEIVVNSGGGSAFEGAAIHAELRAYSGRVRVMVRGVAASAASLIAMAGDEIEIDPAALMMIHDPGAMTIGPADAHRKSADTLDQLGETYAAVYANRSGNPVAVVRQWMREELWMTAEEAVERGFADRIAAEAAPEPVAAFDYTRFSHAPRRLVALAQAQGWRTQMKPIMGERLASFLNRAIDDAVTEERTRADVIEDMAAAAGIEPGTVNQILNGSINCPPRERLEGFAEVLDVTVEQQIAAAEQDGCDYSTEAEARMAGCPCTTTEAGMTTKTTKTPDPTLAADATAKAVKAERDRASGIRQAVAAARLDPTMADQLIDEGVSLDTARERIIAKWAEMGDNHVNPPRATVGRSFDYGDGLRARMIDGLRARVNPAHTPEIGRDFAQMTLAEMAAHTLSVRGIRYEGGLRGAVEMAIGGTHTGSDFPEILAGTVSREVGDAFVQRQAAFFELSRRLPAPDFRQRTRPRLSTGPELEKDSGDGAELRYGTFEEGGENAPKVDTYRKGFNLGRQAIINDDLGAFAAIPGEMARGAITTGRNVFAALFAANSGNGPTMSDGKTLFHADHGNLAAAGGAINVTTVSAAVTAMRRQTGLAGEIIDIRPFALFVPPEKETEALQVVADITAAQVAEANPFAGRLRVIVEPGLADTTRWYVSADPAMAEGLAHSFLDGTTGPQVFQRDGWDIEGIEFKVRMDFGAAFIDFRSWYSNPGA